MSIQIKSTKSFYNLPCAHRQYADTNPDGKPGVCSGLHGYDRSVHFTFSGNIDEYGWIFPFGDLKPVRKFLEYYFDHTAIVGADDPGLDDLSEGLIEPGGILSSLRVLPYGVSMEMSSLFIWEHVNPYIYHITGGRVWVERVECKEHDKNSAFIEVSEVSAVNQAKQFNPTANFLPLKPHWEYEKPKLALSRISMK